FYFDFKYFFKPSKYLGKFQKKNLPESRKKKMMILRRMKVSSFRMNNLGFNIFLADPYRQITRILAILAMFFAFAVCSIAQTTQAIPPSQLQPLPSPQTPPNPTANPIPGATPPAQQQQPQQTVPPGNNQTQQQQQPNQTQTQTNFTAKPPTAVPSTQQ